MLQGFGSYPTMGRVARPAMDRTFHNGVGFVLVVAKRHADRVLAHVQARHARPAVICVIVAGRPGSSF